MHITNLLNYIDPATTALVWQILAGVFITLGVVFVAFWRKITTFFKGLWVKVFKKKENKNIEKELSQVDKELEE